MTSETTRVAVLPHGTLEADSLVLLVRAAGLEVVSRESGADVVLVALPRSPSLSHESFLDLRDHKAVLVIAEPADRQATLLASRLGKRTLLSWSCTSRQVLAAVCSAASGREPRHELHAPRPTDPFVRLTARERDVIELVACAYSDERVADALGITLNTVRTHVQRAMGKLQVTHRHAAAALARRSPVMSARLNGVQQASRKEPVT